MAEGGVAFKAIAEAIGKALRLPTTTVAPEQAQAHFGWFAPLAAMDAPCASELTRDRLGWAPRQPGLLEDVADPAYFGLAEA